jgi:hypothetical protein
MGRFNMAAKAHMTMAELFEATLSGGEAAKTTVLSPDSVNNELNSNIKILMFYSVEISY